MTFTQLAVYAQYHDSELFHINAGSHRAFIFSTIQYSSMCVHMCVFTSVLLLTDTDTDFFFFFFAVTNLTAMNTVNTSPWAHGQELF